MLGLFAGCDNVFGRPFSDDAVAMADATPDATPTCFREQFEVELGELEQWTLADENNVPNTFLQTNGRLELTFKPSDPASSNAITSKVPIDLRDGSIEAAPIAQLGLETETSFGVFTDNENGYYFTIVGDDPAQQAPSSIIFRQIVDGLVTELAPLETYSPSRHAKLRIAQDPDSSQLWLQVEDTAAWRVVATVSPLPAPIDRVFVRIASAISEIGNGGTAYWDDVVHASPRCMP